MRITQIFYRHTNNRVGVGRKPQIPDKTPFREIMPLQLKERVSGKFDQNKPMGCAQEVVTLVQCLQKYDYENKMCNKELNGLNQCYQRYLKDRHLAKRSQEKGTLVPGDSQLTHKQIKNLFKKNPLIRS